MAEFVKLHSLIPHISDDVLILIFLKLPLRCLLLFRSVSKHWLNLIQNPTFISIHTNQPISNRPNPMLIIQTGNFQWKPKNRDNDFFLINILHDDQLETRLPLDFVLPNANREGTLRLYGPCNGLFCITDTVNAVVFNPTTRRCRKVPRSPCSGDYRHTFRSVGFGFDRVSNEYKLVRFDDVDNGDEDTLDYVTRVYRAEVFNLSTNRWGKIRNFVDTCSFYGIYGYSLFLYGAFHWLQLISEETILVFDLNKESFRHFELPYNYNRQFRYCLSLSVLNEALAMVVCRKYDNHVGLDGFDIWVMMEYGVHKSWMNLYNINSGMDIKRPLSFGEGGEFFVEKGDGQVVSLDINTRVIKEFQVYGVSGPMYAFRYRERLDSLKYCKGQKKVKRKWSTFFE